MSSATTQRVTAAFRTGPLAVRSFRLLTSGQFASTIGDYCYAVALPWLVLSNHGSTVVLGIVLACYGAPRTVMMPIGGVLADKIGPRTLMLFADVVRCVLVGLLTFLAARHSASLIALGPIAAFIGAGEGLFLPASFSIMPSLLDERRLTSGNALNSAAVQIGTLLGPALGGVLVATTGGSTAAMGVDAASFAVSALSLTFMPRRAAADSMAATAARAAASPAASTASTASAEPAARPQGMLDYIRKSRAMQVILLTAIVMNMANGGMIEVALPALAHARWGAGGYGALLACMAGGAVLGTLLASRTGRLKAPGYIASVGFIVEGGAIALVPYLGGEAGAAVALLLIGAASGVGGVIFYTVAQRHIPSAILGRVMGVIMMCGAGSYPLSVLVTGLLVGHLGTTPFFPIAGIILTVSVAAGNTSREFRDFAHVPQLSPLSREWCDIAMNPAVDEMSGAGYQCPRDPVEIWLARQWQQVLGFAVGIGENFFGVGGNSLDAARVIDAVMTEFGIQLPLNVLTEHPTVEGLAALLRDHGERLSGPLVAIQDGDGTGPALFLVHPDSGQAGPYCRLAHELGEEFAVVGIQAAGLYSDAEPRRSVTAMADAYADAVREARPAGPYLLGGAGVGAAVAYEMAVRLQDVGLVAVIDNRLLEPAGAGSWPGPLPGQPDVAGILASWQERGLVPPDTAPEFITRSLRVWQAGQDALRDWQPSPYTGPVDIFGQPPAMSLPATAAQRIHPCGADGQLADALRELLG